MKKKLFLCLSLIVAPSIVWGQQLTDYNKKGDEAMERKDYREAKMWYEEGVARCDAYSIEKLTLIWLQNEAMRPSMRSLMNKCLNCSNVQATEDDTTAMRRLIVYYKEGIGTPTNHVLAQHWQDKLEEARKPKISFEEYVRRMEATNQRNRTKMKFFAGYNYSIEMPFGLQVGGLGEQFGWYVRFKTNMSFPRYEWQCKNANDGELINVSDPYAFTGQKEVSAYAGTVGLMVKCQSWLYVSAGLGYGSRDVGYEFVMKDYHSGETSYTDWAKNIDASNRGVAADLDLHFRWNSLLFHAGCSTVNFKYIDMNAGVSVLF